MMLLRKLDSNLRIQSQILYSSSKSSNHWSMLINLHFHLHMHRLSAFARLSFKTIYQTHQRHAKGAL
jgi:hypothetical protein